MCETELILSGRIAFNNCVAFQRDGFPEYLKQTELLRCIRVILTFLRSVDARESDLDLFPWR